MSTLEPYKRKRSFSKTPEPEGKKENRNTVPHFVVQKHHARRLHYDFRLEHDGVLKSWAVPKGPSMNPNDKRLAMMVEDHPLSYANFEGRIPKGEYGAGEVIVWDRGVYLSDKTTDPKEGKKYITKGLVKGELGIVLLGEKLKGAFTLVKMHGQEDNAWLLIKKNDEYANTEDVTKDTRSVITDKTDEKVTTVAHTAKKKGAVLRKQKANDSMPHHIKPMLAKLVNGAFNRPQWFFEMKWDGYRAIAEIENGNIQLYSRNGNSFVSTYPPIVEALKAIRGTCVVDGEIIALKNGKPDFHTLQQYNEVQATLQYAVFDLLFLNGEDLRDTPLLERKKLLREILPKDERLLFSEHVEEEGVKMFATIKEQHLEGMIGKDAMSVYEEGMRSGAWVKVKNFHEQEAIIVGYTQPRGSRKKFGALVLGAYKNNILTYIGHSGGGFRDTELTDLYTKLSRIKRKTSPIQEEVPVNSKITWVTPRYVCAVRFSEWTKDGRMRHPVYQGLRRDKSPENVVRELPTAEGVEKKTQITKFKSATTPTHAPLITNREKLFWPEEGYTKGDVVDYYNTIAETLLPYLQDRPQNLHRHPNGIDGKSFFHKNIETNVPSFVDTVEVWSESNKKTIRYIVCNNKETLLYIANLGCIELNPWNSRVQNLNNPDYMILDLDPNGRPFDDLVRVANEIHDIFLLASLAHYPKTSGKSGLHIVVPLDGTYPYSDVKNFAEIIMRIVHDRLPEMTSVKRDPKKREHKIYLDYLQNRFGQTLACAYSLRPYPGATVSTPLEWSEVKKGLTPAKFTIQTIEDRLKKKGDIWKATLEQSVDLEDALRRLERSFGK